MIKHAKSFGKKEKVLNYTSNIYQLTRPSKVGEVMSLIRQCQPINLKEWEEFYFDNAYSKTKKPMKISEEVLSELGVRLYEKLTEVVIPEWTASFKEITRKDCIDYIRELTITRTYDGYLLEKSVINDNLAKIFPEIKFEESDPNLDHAGDIDYLGWVGKYAIGIQIKPITAGSNFGNFNISERMQQSFENFEDEYKGRVFIIFSTKENNIKVIRNKEIIDDITNEITRLKIIQK